MPAPADRHDPFDPFGVAAAMGTWCCLLKAAEEIRAIDAEMMDTMLEAEATGPAPGEPDADMRLGNIVTLMRSLKLDPEAVRRRDPAAMRDLEAACLRCTQRDRCARELRAGTAADAHAEFCPNAGRLDRLRRA